MITLLLKQIWNKRRSNGWLWAELFIVFIILWYVIDFLLTAFYTSAEPKGFDTRHVYHISMPMNPTLRDSFTPEARAESYLQIVRQVKEYAGVESVCYYAGTIPYEEGSMFQAYTADSLHQYRANIRMVSKDFFDVFRVDMQQAVPENWDIPDYPRPAIISQDLADSLYAGKATLGQPFFDYYAPMKKYILGGIASRTKLTEYDRYAPFIYVPAEDWMLMQWSPVLSLRVHPEADRNFAERFTADMQHLSIGPFYFSQIKSYDEAKAIFDTQTNNYIRTSFAILLFFVFNIFLSITGTFWFRTRKRRAEIGLRMSIGASRKQIFTELIGESAFILLIAVVPAFIVCFNIWWADITVNTWMDASLPRFWVGTACTLLLMMVMVLAGIVYPAYKAMCIEPAEALRNN